MAALPTESISSSPARQAIFTQEKLEKFYIKTHRYLRPYKNIIELAQEVLVWKKPVVSALLFVGVHWLFITYVYCSATLVTAVGNILFWGLLGDVLLRAATKDGFSGPDSKGVGVAGTRGRRGNRGNALLNMTPRLESALIQSHRPREKGELPSFEVVCLWVSEGIMWLDNLVLAYRHWSVNEPVIFAIGLAVPGLVMSLMGKYIPNTVFLYLQVITLLVVPYVEHHCLRQRVLAYISAKYPSVLSKAQGFWNFLKKITVNRDRTEDPTLSLAQGVDELRTQFSLQEAFEQATARPHPPAQSSDKLELPPMTSSSEGGVAGGVASVPELDESQGVIKGTPPHLYAPQSTSMDSLTLDSFGGQADFPSISELDMSLALPQFPSGDYVNSIMPTITEEQEEEPLRPQVSNLEFHDSSDFHDSRSTQLRPQASHPLAETRRADPISAQPSAPPRSTGFDSLGFSMYTTPANTGLSDLSGGTGQQEGYLSNFVPPPTYQQVARGSPEAGVTVDGTPGQRESSTSIDHDGEDSWGVKKRPPSGAY